MLRCTCLDTSTVPVKTGAAYATNVPPARLLYAAVLRNATRGTIRSVPVKTGTAYATNVPLARLLHAAALRPNLVWPTLLRF